jgi:hypothetical protein
MAGPAGLFTSQESPIARKIIRRFTIKIGYAISAYLRYDIGKGTFFSNYTSVIYSQAQAMPFGALLCAVRSTIRRL